MPFVLTDFDQELLKTGARLELIKKIDIAGGYVDAGRGAGVIPFQFPPRVSSDSKQAKFIYLDYWAWEPVAIYRGADSRKITLRATYVVTNSSDGRLTWNVDQVDKVLRAYKQYFYGRVSKDQVFPVFKLHVYQHVPKAGEGASGKISTWRGLNVSIKPSSTVMKHNGQYIHMINEIDLSLELMSNIETKDGKQTEHQIISKPEQVWY